MDNDTNLWLIGGKGTVGAVLLLKWDWGATNNVSRGVCGAAEMYTLGDDGMLVLRQQEIVFPVPVQERAAPEFHQPRSVVLGEDCENPEGTLPLGINDLSDVARRSMASMGLDEA
ncbi:hypothetical protein BDW59DRAFT_161765 [Aspergillus cavernicola]|uniref:Uncharacterized protein n=1 Tax=Aspergillus cavernicola TaxID=176166 RepID=A0ABR4IC18_9EURO